MSLRLSACGASCINKMNSIEYVCLSGHSYDIKYWIAYMKRATTASEDIEAKNVRVIRHVRHMWFLHVIILLCLLVYHRVQN